jgi:hypothetical protein
MEQLELFPLNLLEQAGRQARAVSLQEMLCKVNDAHADYVSRFDGMYADHVIFTDGDTPTFTIIPEFWPDLASDYMNDAHPTVYYRVCESIDNSFAN